MPKHKSKPPKRSQGAQPGNTNALQHGIYSVRAADGAVISAITSQGDATADGAVTSDPNLEREIKLLRRMINRCAELIETADPHRIESLLNTLGAASIRVGTRLKTQKFLTGGKGEIGDLLQQALRDVLDEVPSRTGFE